MLRSGPLELLACSPKTREHESILVVDARPLHVYQALGLIGLAPGSPSRFDEASRKSIPPSGEPTVVEVRFRLAGGEQTVPAEKWLLDVKTKQSPESLNWVFAGSKTLEDGRFLADLDGTVVCVVDFDSALVAVGETHSRRKRSALGECECPNHSSRRHAVHAYLPSQGAGGIGDRCASRRFLSPGR